MKAWHWMVVGLVVWLTFAALALRWVLRPYLWRMAPQLGGQRDMAAMRADFYFHLAPFPVADPSRPPADEEEFDRDEELVNDWIWRETMRRFILGFSLWMFSGWFVHWFTTRIIHGPQRWRARGQ